MKKHKTWKGKLDPQKLFGQKIAPPVEWKEHIRHKKPIEEEKVCQKTYKTTPTFCAQINWVTALSYLDDITVLLMNMEILISI